MGWLLLVDKISVGMKTNKKLPTAMEVLQMREGFRFFSSRAVIYLSRSLPHVQERVLLSDGNKKISQDVWCIQNLP
jgi:hypothetical protein